MFRGLVIVGIDDDLVRSVSNKKFRIFGELSPSKVNDV